MEETPPEALPEEGKPRNADRQQDDTVTLSRKQLETLLQIGYAFNSSLDIDSVMKTVMDRIIEVMKAERGFIVMANEETGDLEVRIARNLDKSTIEGNEFQVSRNTMKTVWNTETPLLTSNAMDDPRMASFSSVTTFSLRSILCVPMLHLGKVTGLIYIDNRMRRSVFRQIDVEMLKAIASHAATAIENARSYRNAITDRLTGIYNFGCFREHLATETRWHLQNKEALSLILIDIDHFKNFNDVHGHHSGNGALKRTADIMREAARSQDLLARYGGEEFAMLLPRTAWEEALQVAEALRRSVEKEPYEGGERQPLGKVTISAGVASFPEHAACDDELIIAADQALYRSKQQGRNRVTLAGEQ